MTAIQPSYLELHQNGKLAQRINWFEEVYKKCSLCPHNCQGNRFESSDGFCRTGAQARVASYQPHFGEEKPLVGTGGSGTIFFSSCNLRCVYCQNYDISQKQAGLLVTAEKLADIMLLLQKRGCHNINFVSPTHVILSIMKALPIAIERGLKIPLVYNSGGYDSVASLKMLEGIFDIYMPDMKYFEAPSGLELSEAMQYPVICQKAVLEMHRQVGDLITDSQGIAQRGLIIRHLVLPNHIEESLHIVDFVAAMSKSSFFNIMNQYRPEYRAFTCKKINRRLDEEPYQTVLQYARNSGIKWIDKHA